MKAVSRAATGGPMSWQAWACFVVLAVGVSFAGIGSHSLWTPDEPRDAAIGRTMWRSGDLVVPWLNGRPFLEKPPLSWWTQTVAYQWLGASDTTARVPSAVFGALTLAVVFLLGRRLGGARAGWLSAGVLASTIEYAEDMRRAIVDPPMIFAVAVSYLGFVLLAGEAEAPPATRGAATGAPPARWHLWSIRCAIALAVTASFLDKAMIGLCMAAAPPVLFLLGEAAWIVWQNRRAARRDAAERLPSAGGGAASPWRTVWRIVGPVLLAGAPLFAAVVLPWVLALLREGGWPMLRECLVGNTVGRLFPTAAGQVYGHRLPPWYYLTSGSLALLPWVLALPAVLRGLLPRHRQAPAPDDTAAAGAAVDPVVEGARQDPGRLAWLLLGSFLIGTAILSIAASKRTVYLVPLLPGLSVVIALWLASLGPLGSLGSLGDGRGDGDPPSRTGPAAARGGPWDRATALVLLALAALLPVIFWGAAWAAAHGAVVSIPTAPLRLTLTATRLAAGGVLAAAAAGLLLARWVRHWRDRSTPSAPWLVIPFLALTLIYQTAIKAAVEPLKDPHPLTAAIGRLDPGGAAVAAYRPSETTEGIVQFDLDRRVEPIDSPETLATFLARQPHRTVVLPLDILQHLPIDLRRRLCVLYDESATKASPFAIVASCAAARRS